MWLPPEVQIQGFQFLIQVGKVALNHLKEIWTLRRKAQTAQISMVDQAISPDVQKEQINDLLKGLVPDFAAEQVKEVIEQIGIRSDILAMLEKTNLYNEKQSLLGRMTLAELELNRAQNLKSIQE